MMQPERNHSTRWRPPASTRIDTNRGSAGEMELKVKGPEQIWLRSIPLIRVRSTSAGTPVHRGSLPGFAREAAERMEAVLTSASNVGRAWSGVSPNELVGSTASADSTPGKVCCIDGSCE